MTFKDVAAVSGKPGLFKIIKPSRTGVILESLDAEKKRILAGTSQRISVLQEVSIYTNTETGTIPLEDVFKRIQEKHGNSLEVNPKADGNELATFMKGIVPEYDTDKVYGSDIRKLIAWYIIVMQELPELMAPAAPDEGEKQKPAKKTKKAAAEPGEKGDKKPKKAPAKKKS